MRTFLTILCPTVFTVGVFSTLLLIEKTNYSLAMIIALSTGLATYGLYKITEK